MLINDQLTVLFLSPIPHNKDTCQKNHKNYSQADADRGSKTTQRTEEIICNDKTKNNYNLHSDI